MTVYIAYRDLEKHYFESTLCGGPPGNPDYRLASVKENIYVLTWNNKNYAVPKERAERFVKLVADTQPDVIGTQECTQQWKDLLRKGSFFRPVRSFIQSYT